MFRLGTCLREKGAGIEDPEQKIKIIGREFIVVFDDFAHKLEQKKGKRPEYLVQGTLYTDVIEQKPSQCRWPSKKYEVKTH